jgi:hypothetical protein
LADDCPTTTAGSEPIHPSEESSDDHHTHKNLFLHSKIAPQQHRRLDNNIHDTLAMPVINGKHRLGKSFTLFLLVLLWTCFIHAFSFTPLHHSHHYSVMSPSSNNNGHEKPQPSPRSVVVSVNMSDGDYNEDDETNSVRVKPGTHDELMYALGVNLARQLGDIRPLVANGEELSMVAKGLLDTVVGRLNDDAQRLLLQGRGQELDDLILHRA